MSMNRKIHFISGLPRSGSTLLAALLRQNPAFSADISSPVAVMLCGLQQALSGKSEFHTQVTDTKRRAVLRGAIDGYFVDIDPAKTVFDTNRLWCSKIDTVADMFPTARLICCARPLSWVYDSFEQIVRRNALEPSRMFNHEAFGTVYTRIETLNHPLQGSVGASYNGLKEAFYGHHAERMIVVTYESLAGQPEQTLRRLYEFLGERLYAHDFDNVAFESAEFDRAMGTPGLHSVRNKVGLIKRDTILPPDLFRRFQDSAFWLLPENNPRGVCVI